MDYVFSFFLRRLFTFKMCEQAQVLWLENTTSSPEPSHRNALKNCLQKQTLLLPLTLELFSAQLQKERQRLATSQPVVNGVLSVEARPFSCWQMNYMNPPLLSNCIKHHTACKGCFSLLTVQGAPNA